MSAGKKCFLHVLYLCAMGVDDLDGVSLLHPHCLALATRNQDEVGLGPGLDCGGCGCRNRKSSALPCDRACAGERGVMEG